MTRNCARTRWQRLLARLRDSSGANLIEAAIVLPLLVLLTFSIVDFASMFWVYLALENGVSQASRYGVTNQLMQDPSNPGTYMTRLDSIKTAMRDATPNISIPDSDFTFSYMSPGATGWSAGPGGPGDITKITVNHNWDLLTPVLRPFFPSGQVQISVSSAMKNEPAATGS